MQQKKPDPAIYTAAAQKLGVQPNECVVVEDNNMGLKVGGSPRGVDCLAFCCT